VSAIVGFPIFDHVSYASVWRLFLLVRGNIIAVFYKGNSMAEETRGQYQRLGYKIRAPGPPPVDYLYNVTLVC